MGAGVLDGDLPVDIAPDRDDDGCIKPVGAVWRDLFGDLQLGIDGAGVLCPGILQIAYAAIIWIASLYRHHVLVSPVVCSSLNDAGGSLVRCQRIIKAGA